VGDVADRDRVGGGDGVGRGGWDVCEVAVGDGSDGVGVQFRGLIPTRVGRADWRVTALGAGTTSVGE
jgi:hypothetical protein